MHKHLHHLTWFREESPTFFITTCTDRRKRCLAAPIVVSILVEEWRLALSRHGWMVGRYVIMPDHVHFFCASDEENAKSLSGFMQNWKQWTSKRIYRECGLSSPLWQAGFFDHRLRSAKSSRQKWEYVVENPVRAGLATHASDWPWQGEIFPVDMDISR